MLSTKMLLEGCWGGGGSHLHVFSHTVVSLESLALEKYFVSKESRLIISNLSIFQSAFLEPSDFIRKNSLSNVAMICLVLALLSSDLVC